MPKTVLFFSCIALLFGPLVGQENWATIAIKGLSENFKNKTNRISVGKEIFHHLPTPVSVISSDNSIDISKKMNYELNKQKTIEFLGQPKPNSQNNQLIYQLGFENGSSYALVITLSSNVVSGKSIVTTK
jgi:stalled ribosome rescue protein Dom34